MCRLESQVDTRLQGLGADLDRFARAHAAQRRGEVLPDPVLEVTIPSTHDQSLARAGMHTLTLGVMHVPRELASGCWDDYREPFGDLVVERLAAFAPNVPDAIVDRRVATPLDLERTFGLTEGNIFHGAMTPSQLFSRRPLPGWSNYRMPVQDLYLCGAGTHPGGAVSGAPGHNAAHELLADTCLGSLSREEWLQRANREVGLPTVSKRGHLLCALARRPPSRWAIDTLARRRFMRPAIRRLTSTR